MIVCQECGNSAPSVDGFCSSCGGLLEWSGEQVATPPPPPPYAPPLLAAGGPGWSLPTLSAPPHAYQPSQAHQPPQAHQPSQAHQPAAVRPDAEAVRPAPQQLVNGPQYDGLFCSACGTRNLDGRTFCRYCGHELDLTVATGPARLRWWQRLFRRTPKAAPRAGERPGNFGKRERTASGAGGGGKRRHGWTARRPPLSKIAPVLLVLGLMGIGIGPARLWLTQHAGDLIGKAKNHVTQNLAPVSAVSASASSSASGHPAALLIDGVSTTAWQSAAHAGGIGESVTITFANPVDIDNIEILDGLDADKYLTQARLRTASVTADGKAAGDISFNDKADLQGASVKLQGVTKVTLVITATYPGQQGQAVAIRELEFRVLQ